MIFTEDNRIKASCDRPKKITGTRLAQILQINSPYNTPFQGWCDMMKVYAKPFEDNKYTLAGKTIEPKVAQYFKENYIGNYFLKTPTDVYGQDYFNKTYGDFFPEEKIFGGMWDFLITDKDNNIVTVIENKTAQEKNRTKQWTNNGKNIVPANYILQSALYAYLLKVNNILVISSFLKPEDYVNPQLFIPDKNNTVLYNLKLDKDVPNFEDFYIKPAIDWYERHIVKGISPQFDLSNSIDKEIVDAMKGEM